MSTQSDGPNVNEKLFWLFERGKQNLIGNAGQLDVGAYKNHQMNNAF